MNYICCIHVFWSILAKVFFFSWGWGGVWRGAQAPLIANSKVPLQFLHRRDLLFPNKGGEKKLYLTCVCIGTAYTCCKNTRTSFSLLSYFEAFFPWLFLLSFFRSDCDLSSESCFILCSVWYLLKVACGQTVFDQCHSGTGRRVHTRMVCKCKDEFDWLLL